MGFFRFARTTPSRLSPPPTGIGRGRWPEVLWCGPSPAMPHDRSVYSLHPLISSRVSHIKNSSAAGLLHRWMLRTLERSPPVRIRVSVPQHRVSWQ